MNEIEQQRAAFVKWVSENPLHVTGSTWSAWQAAIALDRQQRGEPVKALLQQARLVRNYSDPGQVFEAVPVSAFGSEAAPQPAEPVVKESLPSDRCGFEAWYEHEYETIHGPLVWLDGEDCYENTDHELMYQAWKAKPVAKQLLAGDEREAFEGWYIRKFGGSLVDDYGREKPTVYCAREAWQARAALAQSTDAVRLPEYTASIGSAGQMYLDKFPHAHALPSEFRWRDLWAEMCKAAQPTTQQSLQVANVGSSTPNVGSSGANVGSLPVTPEEDEAWQEMERKQ